MWEAGCNFRLLVVLLILRRCIRRRLILKGDTVNSLVHFMTNPSQAFPGLAYNKSLLFSELQTEPGAVL